MYKQYNVVPRKKSSKEKGAVLIQLAIGLPIFLFLILFVVWLGTYLNAKVSIQAALKAATRAGVTRGLMSTWDDLYTVDGIKQWSSGSPPQNIQNMLAYGSVKGTPITFDDALKFYKEVTITPVYGERDLWKMPPEFKYTLIYLNESLRLSLGGQVKFPCRSLSGYPTGILPEELEPGCIQCTFLHPDCQDFTPLDGIEVTDPKQKDPNAKVWRCQDGTAIDIPSYDINLLRGGMIPRGKVVLGCSYKLDSTILNPLLALIKIFSQESYAKLSNISAQAESSPIRIPSRVQVPNNTPLTGVAPNLIGK